MHRNISTSTFFKIWIGNCFIFLIQTFILAFFNFLSQESIFFVIFMLVYLLNIFTGLASFILGLAQLIHEKIKGSIDVNKIKKESKKYIANKTKKIFYFWLATIGLFYLIIFLVNGDFSTASIFYILTFLFDILLGVITFLIMLYLIFKNKLWDLFVITLFIFFTFFIILPKLPNRNNQVNNNINSDLLVDCLINEKCGGGYKRLKQSDCINSTCCQIGSSWIVMDKDQCKLKQEEYSQSAKTNPVYIQPPPQIQIPKIEVPICCKENCNSFTGTCTTRCERSWFCF